MLSIDDVKKVAKLSKLNLSIEEMAKLLAHLSAALDYTDILTKVDTDKVAPTLQVSGQLNVLEEDVARISLTNEEALANAPLKSKGYILTKAVLKKNM